MKTHYPSVREQITLFAREVLQYKREANVDTVDILQLDDRYQNYCGPCEQFNGLACDNYGCPDKRWVRNRYYDLILDPQRACPFKDDGFKAIGHNG